MERNAGELSHTFYATVKGSKILKAEEQKQAWVKETTPDWIDENHKRLKGRGIEFAIAWPRSTEENWRKQH